MEAHAFCISTERAIVVAYCFKLGNLKVEGATFSFLSEKVLNILNFPGYFTKLAIGVCLSSPIAKELR